MVKIFLFFQKQPSPSQKTPPYLYFLIFSLHPPTHMATKNQVVEEMPSSHLKQQTNSTEQNFTEQNIITNQMKYNEFQRKRFQILCIQTLFNRMKKSLENETPISPSEQRNLLNSLYHFFELNVKDIKIDDYIKFHNLIPNPSATPIYVQYNQNPPEELLILPPSESLMETQTTNELVRWTSKNFQKLEKFTKNFIYFYYNTKYFRNLLKNMNNFNNTNDYLQEKIRIATVEMNRKSTLLMNLMFSKPDSPTTLPIYDSSDDNSDDMWCHYSQSLSTDVNNPIKTFHNRQILTVLQLHLHYDFEFSIKSSDDWCSPPPTTIQPPPPPSTINHRQPTPVTSKLNVIYSKLNVIYCKLNVIYCHWWWHDCHFEVLLWWLFICLQCSILRKLTDKFKF